MAMPLMASRARQRWRSTIRLVSGRLPEYVVRVCAAEVEILARLECAGRPPPRQLSVDGVGIGAVRLGDWSADNCHAQRNAPPHRPWRWPSSHMQGGIRCCGGNVANNVISATYLARKSRLSRPPDPFLARCGVPLSLHSCSSSRAAILELGAKLPVHHMILHLAYAYTSIMIHPLCRARGIALAGSIRQVVSFGPQPGVVHCPPIFSPSAPPSSCFMLQ